MITEENGRLVISCDRCPVRLDLGPKPLVEKRNRMPSMWKNLGGDQHLCSSCAESYGRGRFARTPSSETIFR